MENGDYSNIAKTSIISFEKELLLRESNVWIV